MAKAGFGGLGMVAILIMARVLPARESTGAILPMLILADVFAVYTYRAHRQRQCSVLRMLLPASLGLSRGWLLMPHIPAKNFGPFIGWLTLALVVLVLVQKFAPRVMNLAVEHPGIACALRMARAAQLLMIANAAGPVMTIYLLSLVGSPKFGVRRHGPHGSSLRSISLKVPFSASLGLDQLCQSRKMNPGWHRQ